MAKREKSKDVVLNDRKFRINKFDAQTGSYIIYQLFTNFIPMLGSLKLDKLSLDMKPEELGSILPKALPMLPKDQFFKLQQDCLEVCYEITDVGGVETPVKVIMVDGRFGVEDLEDDVFAVMALMIHSLIFNVSGFFGESGLKGLGETFKGLSR